jgi:hypothetical protein
MAQTAPNLPNRGLPETERRAARAEAQALDAIDSKAIHVDQDMCQMKHVTEASSTEQQTDISFMKSPRP